jgi:transcriptional/translational regulatory protein YebC/TACO1
MIPQSEIEVTRGDAERLLRLFEVLEGHDDVQKVSSNANIDERVMEEAMS